MCDEVDADEGNWEGPLGFIETSAIDNTYRGRNFV